MIIFDRSRHEAFEKCPRLRFLEYEYPGVEHHGLTRLALAVPLLTGAMVHRGIEQFLRAIDTPIAYIPSIEDYPVQIALERYDAEISERGIEQDDLAPESTWVIKVQRALIEALVRGWIRVVWPRIQNEFDVLEVEREERATFTHATHDDDFVLMARTDALVQRRSDGALFVRNLKTMSEASLRRLEAFRFDTQTISEVLAVEQRLQNADSHNNVIVQGVIYDLLIKGPRKQEYPRKSGVWHNNSPLIWCWMREGQTGITDNDFALAWNYTCKEPHAMGRKECPGGENHTLGKGWERKLVTDVFPGGIPAWFDWLEENASGTLDEQFQTLPAIMRTPFDIETWKRAVLNEEGHIAHQAQLCREVIEQQGFIGALPALDDMFPKHTAHGNCLFPSKCPMFDVCWGAAGQALDDGNINEAGYTERKPNHPEDINAVVEDDRAAM